MPPFDGPRAMLCTTRKPVNPSVLPSSIETGIATSTAFLHSCRTLMRFWSIPKTSPTSLSCSRAIWKGFSRRCDTASVAATTLSFRRMRGEYTCLFDRELDHGNACRAGQTRHCRHAKSVPTLGQCVARRGATGEAERVATGQQIAQCGERPELVTSAVEQIEREQRDGLHGVATRFVGQRPGSKGQQCGPRVRGRERRRGQRSEEHTSELQS